ncbi:MAG: NADPH-dependent FMN reductase [Halioglobus sp.]
MKILTFAASNSKKSINKTLAAYAASQIDNAEVELVDINDYEMPLFSVDREQELGSPQEAKNFFQKIGAADAIIISFAEHNGSYTAAYKNLFDWVSRIETKVFQQKPVVYLSTSPGPGGASNVLASAVQSAPHFGADLKSSLSVPSFYDNFDGDNNRITNSDIQIDLERALGTLISA